MRFFTRLIVCAATAMLLSAVLFHAADAWIGEKTSVVGAARQIVLETRRSEALQERTTMIARSLTVKHDIINQLLAGRLRFRQAIEQFHKANHLVQNIDLISPYQTPPYPEGVARQVLIWVRNSVVSWPPDKGHHLLADLVCEYQTLFDGSKPEESAGMWPMDTILTGRTQASFTD